MLTLSPKAQYASVHEAEVEAYRRMVRSQHFTVGAMYAMAALAVNAISQEQMQGARAFLHQMLNLCEPEDKPQPLPTKDLKNA